MQILQEQYYTVQNYVCSLFDSLPRIILPQQSNPETLIQKCIEQNMQYGRKIIELSQKFTAKYRKDHFVERRDTEQKILQIYKVLAVERQVSLRGGMDQMVDVILQQVIKNKERQLKANTTQSDNREGHRVPISELGKERQREEMSMSRKRSKGSKQKNSKQDQTFTTMNVLQLKGCFEQEQTQIRQLYDKIRRASLANHIHLSEQNLTYSKSENQNSNNLMSFVKANTHNHCQNIQRIQQLFTGIVEGFQKKIRKEGMAQSRFNLYRQEIEKREDVYSYAVSKMLENVDSLRCGLNAEKYDECHRLANNLDDIAQKFYELYPSDKIIKDLNTEKIVYQGSKNQAVQVNTVKERSNTSTSDVKRSQIQTYKMAIKMNEFIDHFEKSIRHKKQIQSKQVQRVLQSLRELIPKKNQQLLSNGVSSSNSHHSSIPGEVVVFQQEIKKIIEINQKHEKDMGEDYARKNKKLEKRVGQLERALQEIMIQMNTFKEQKQQEKKKLHKKLEQQKQETNKVKGHKEKVQKNLDQLIEQINRLRKQTKTDKQTYEDQLKQLQLQKEQLKQSIQNMNQKLNQAQKRLDDERQKIAEERKVYKQKIVIMETKEEQNQLNEHKYQQDLSTVLKENQVLKKQIEQFSELYQEKIREVEEMIEDIKKLQHELETRTLKVQQLQQQQRIHIQIIKNHEEQLQKTLLKNQQLKEQLKGSANQTAKYRQIGVLNQEDINILKDEMEKVKTAYLQSQEQVEQLKIYCQQLQNDKNRVCRERTKLSKVAEQLQDNLQNQKDTRDRLEKDLLDTQNQLTLKDKQLYQRNREIQEYKRDSLKVRKECTQLRQAVVRLQRENREQRQQIQKKREQDGLQNGKRKLELEAMKVQLRRKTQQLQKQKDQHLQQTQLLQQKNSQLHQLITQKQMLMRITNQHMTS